MSSLQVEFLDVNYKNPLILPSGIIQDIPSHKKAEDAGAGGITMKSVTVNPREGNPLPRVCKYEHGYLNSVGLRNPGIKKAVYQLKNFIKQTKVPVIASVFATNISDFKLLAKKITKANPDFLELNLSCPNTTNELGEPLGLGPQSAREAVFEVRKTIGKDIKVIAKLSPNVQNIGQVAKAVEKAGADAISAINTVGPGMVIDIKTGKPILGNKEGGVSGPGIRPIAVRCVYDIYEAVEIPIIGIGGVEKWEDVVEMMMAGATLVGIGSAVYMHGYKIYKDTKKGLKKYMKENKINSLSEIIGIAHSDKK